MNFSIDSAIDGALLVSEITFKNTAHSDQLWQERLEPLINTMAEHDTLETLRADPAIQATNRLAKIRVATAPQVTVCGGG